MAQHEQRTPAALTAQIEGVVSAGSPASVQLDWVDEARWPRRPYCTDDLSRGLAVRSLRQALARQYIQANPPHLRCWSIYDCDYEGAAGAWLDVLPIPTWIARNRLNDHAHLVWGLSAPVLVDGAGLHDGPVRYLAAVEGGIRAAIRGDPGYSGLITKNPRHPVWDTRTSGALYELSKLADYVDLRRHLPKRGTQAGEIGLGRNCTLFDRLRVWAYPAIRLYRGAGRAAPGAWCAWQNECYDRALSFNGEFTRPLALNEARHVARSVGKWVWQRDPAALAAFQTRQSWKGRRGGAASGLARRKGTPLERDRAPWTADGISRATWYRRRETEA